MASFIREKNGAIYMYHWLDSKNKIKKSTWLKVPEEEWDKDLQRPKDPGFKHKNRSVAKEIARFEKALDIALYEFGTLDESEKNIGKLRELFEQYERSGGFPRTGVKQTDFMKYFSDRLEHYKEIGQSNYNSYRTTYRRIEKYQHGRDLTFNGVNKDFYEKFGAFLVKEGLAKNTIASQWKNIKVIMKDAHEKGKHTNIAYQGFKREQEESDNIYLSEDELKAMWDLDLDDHLEKARDFFILGAYTGLRVSDWDKIHLPSKGDVLMVRSQKTSEKSIIPIHPIVREILNKYGGLMPKKPSDQKINDYIKVVGAQAGIDEDVTKSITKGGKKEYKTVPKWKLITTHTARRSLATNLILSGASPYLVMRITGHKSIESFEKYIKLNDLMATMELKELEFFR